MIFFNEKKIRKIRIIFDIENWLWKSEIRIFQSPPAKRTLICQKKFLWKSAIFHSIKLPFDAEVAEKILNGIYWICSPYVFTDSRYHINFAKVENGELLPRIKNMHHNCTSYCHQPLDDLCRRNKFHISKTVRLGLDVASKFLEDPDVKIIYVIRDPRGIK